MAMPPLIRGEANFLNLRRISEIGKKGWFLFFLGGREYEKRRRRGWEIKPGNYRKREGG